MYELAIFPLLKATWQTIYMVFISSFISILLGLILGCLLFINAKKQNLFSKIIRCGLSLLINITRSVPFIILMISIIPLTRILMGTTIGTNAAIVPLTVAAIPFFARICESALNEVPYGLVEAAVSMGASTWHLITKVLLPESLPSLIRGATLTMISLIGYSAMAGVVGGGGLGELAINYGYQRFDVLVMIETVIILVVMVQLIQMIGDRLATHRKVKVIFFASMAMWIVCFIYQFWPISTSEGNVLRVGVMSGWPEKVMQVAKQVGLKQEGIHLKIITFTDYVQPNTALQNHSIDVNIFQHAPYLAAQVAAHHYQLIAIGKTFVYPMGFYSKKINRLSELKNNAAVAIPNDPSNGGRALLLLQQSGLIELKKGIGTLATVNDVIKNPLHLQFKLIDAAQLPRVLEDVELVAVTNDFIGPAHLSIKQALLKEDSHSPYANIIVVRDEDKDQPRMRELVNIMHSKPVLEETKKIFPAGAAIPAWLPESDHDVIKH